MKVKELIDRLSACKAVYLGTYATPEEASAAYRGASKAVFGEFAKD